MVVPKICYICSIEHRYPDTPPCSELEFGESSPGKHTYVPGPNRKDNTLCFCEYHREIPEKYTSYETYIAEPMFLVETYALEVKNRRYVDACGIANHIRNKIKEGIYTFPPIVREAFVRLYGEDSLADMFWVSECVIDLALNADVDTYKTFIKRIESEGITFEQILPFMNKRVDKIKSKSELKTILTMLAVIEDK